MNKKRVVITGVGAVCPSTENIEQIWDTIMDGNHIFSELEEEEKKTVGILSAGTIKNFNYEPYFSKREARKMDKFVQYAVAGSSQALSDSMVNVEDIDSKRFGVIIGTQFGGVQTWEEQLSILNKRGPKRVSPYFVPMMIVNMATGQVSMTFGAEGPNTTPVTGMCSGSNAIGDAFNLIKHDEADIMLCGGTEASITPLVVGGYKEKGSITTHPKGEEVCLPFIEESGGFGMSEGSGVLVLESLEHAKNRNAKIYCELVGYGTGFGLEDDNLPAAEGYLASVQAALEDAGIEADDLGYLNASGVGVSSVDHKELDGIRELQKQAKEVLPVSSVKTLLGNFMGASGAIDSIVTIHSIIEGILPADQYGNREMEEDFILNHSITKSIDYAMNNTMDFDGFNTSLIFKRWEDND